MPDQPSVLIPLIDEPAIRRALNAIRQAEPLGDSPFRRLASIHEKLNWHGQPATRAAFDIAVADTLTELIESNLFRLRDLEQIPHPNVLDRDEVLATLRRDFSKHNTELEAWSALYHRYVRVDLDLQAQGIAHLLGADPRQVRRRFKHGFHRLSEVISRRESAARSANWKNWLKLKLPYSSTGVLFGVNEQVDRLLKRFGESAPPKLTALVGPHGIGKTTLAALAARRAIDAELFDDVAWISPAADSDTSTIVALVATALGFSLSDPEPSALEPNLRFRLLNQRTLLVVDDVDRDGNRPETLTALEVVVGPGHVLWISRFRPPPDPPAVMIAVPHLSLADTVNIIAETASQRQTSEPSWLPANIEAVARASGGNPLAARVLAGQIRYLPIERVLENIGSLPAGETDLFGALFVQSWAAISESVQHAAIALALLPPDGAPWEDWLEISGLTPAELDQAIRELIDSCLVEGPNAAHLYSMQSLAREFVSEQARRSPWREKLERRLGSINARYGEDEQSDAGSERSLMSLRYQVQLGDLPNDLASVIEHIAPAARRSGQWVVWRDLLRAVRERIPDTDVLRPAMLRLRLELGVSYRWLGELNAAQTELEEAIAESGEAGDFNTQAKALVELGLLHESAGRFADAEEAYQRAARAAKRYRDTETQRRALIGLAGLALTGNRPALALKLTEEALATFGNDSPDGQAKSMLGHIYLQLGDAQKAIEAGEQALALLLEEGDIPRQSRAHMRLGMAYHAGGQPDKALLHLGQGMGLMKALGDALGQARILTNLGTVYSAGSRFDEALAAWRDAIALQEQLGDRVGMAYTWANLADLQWKMDQRDAARESLARARALAEERELVSLLAHLDVHPAKA